MKSLKPYQAIKLRLSLEACLSRGRSHRSHTLGTQIRHRWMMLLMPLMLLLMLLMLLGGASGLMLLVRASGQARALTQHPKASQRTPGLTASNQCRASALCKCESKTARRHDRNSRSLTCFSSRNPMQCRPSSHRRAARQCSDDAESTPRRRTRMPRVPSGLLRRIFPYMLHKKELKAKKSDRTPKRSDSPPKKTIGVPIQKNKSLFHHRIPPEGMP